MSKKSKDVDFSYVNDEGKLVSGAAALLHEVYSKHDGIRDYNNDVGQSFIGKLLDYISDAANADIEAKSKRKNIKISWFLSLMYFYT